MIFPDEPEQWPDFDEWYDKQNRLVIGGLLALNIVVTIGHGILDGLRPVAEAPDGPAGPVGLAFYVGGALSLFALLVALLFVHNRRWNVAMLVALNLILLSTSILEDYV